VGEAPGVFAAEGLEARSWTNRPGARYAPHRHGHDKLLVCSAGSITFHTPDGDITLHAGDRFDLPAGTEHSATVGPAGVTCWEAAR
jgi:quercetin dioxygenase-like cupin family protein